MNAITKTGRTPLHDAAEGGHFVLVRYLVENAGADVMVKEVGGKTARQMAAGGMGKETGKYLQANETIRGAGKGATSISLVNLGLETIPSQVWELIFMIPFFNICFLLIPFPTAHDLNQPPNHRPPK